VNIPLIGVIENMSDLICPHCGTKIDLFGSGGGEKMAHQMQVNFLGRIPIEVKNRLAGDQGQPIVLHYPDSKTAKAFVQITKNVEDLLK
jgi:ATP-binding protein involved in chromosome partitioning